MEMTLWNRTLMCFPISNQTHIPGINIFVGKALIITDDSYILNKTSVVFFSEGNEMPHLTPSPNAGGPSFPIFPGDK